MREACTRPALHEMLRYGSSHPAYDVVSSWCSFVGISAKTTLADSRSPQVCSFTMDRKATSGLKKSPDTLMQHSVYRENRKRANLIGCKKGYQRVRTTAPALPQTSPRSRVKESCMPSATSSKFGSSNVLAPPRRGGASPNATTATTCTTATADASIRRAANSIFSATVTAALGVRHDRTPPTSLFAAAAAAAPLARQRRLNITVRSLRACAPWGPRTATRLVGGVALLVVVRGDGRGGVVLPPPRGSSLSTSTSGHRNGGTKIFTLLLLIASRPPWSRWRRAVPPPFPCRGAASLPPAAWAAATRRAALFASTVGGRIKTRDEGGVSLDLDGKCEPISAGWFEPTASTAWPRPHCSTTAASYHGKTALRRKDKGVTLWREDVTLPLRAKADLTVHVETWNKPISYAAVCSCNKLQRS